MDIQEAKKELSEAITPSWETINCVLSELDKDNNIISDLQNEVTLKQCELDKKDKIINDMAERIYQLQDEKLLAEYSKQEVIDHFTNKYEEGKNGI